MRPTLLATPWALQSTDSAVLQLSERQQQLSTTKAKLQRRINAITYLSELSISTVLSRYPKFRGAKLGEYALEDKVHHMCVEMVTAQIHVVLTHGHCSVKPTLS